MIRFSFRKGLAFFTKTRKRLTIERTLLNHKLRLESDDGEHVDLTREELTERWSSGQFIVDEESLSARNDVFFTATPKDLKSLDEKDRATAKRRFDLISKVRQLFRRDGGDIISTHAVLAQHIATASEELKVNERPDPDANVKTENDEFEPPSPQTFWRWWTRFRATGCVTKLIDRRARSGRRPNDVQKSVFEEVCMEVFLTTQRRPGKAVWEGVEAKYLRMNRDLPPEKQSPCPSRATVYRWLKELHQSVVMRAREGKAFAERELRAALGQLKVERILERYEIDHTPVDLLLICKETMLVLGRPWLTMILDRRSRMIAGFYISFHAPSAFSVLYSLRMAILPKDHVVAKYDLRNPWPVRGIPDLIVMDNGMDLHADAVQTLSYELGIEQQFCGVADPAMKGAVERLFRTVSADLFHQLPGTVFSNTAQRRDYPSEKLAALDLEKFVEVLVRWIVDVYQVSPHEGLNGRTPLSVWQALESDRVIELPAFPEQLDTIVALSATRTVWHYGIEYDNLRYNSAQLQSLNHATAENAIVGIRSHENDVGYIHVMDPETEEYFVVPAVDQEYAAGLNRHVHLLVCAEARQRWGDDWRREQLLDVKAEIQAIVDEAVRSKKMKTRKTAAKLNALDSEAVLGVQQEALERAGQPVRPSPPARPKPSKPVASGVAEDDLPDLVSTPV